MVGQTSWGSREDGDEHNTFRLQEKPPRSQSMTTPSGPDLPKPLQYSRPSQARRLALACQSHEFNGCTVATESVYPTTIASSITKSPITKGGTDLADQKTSDWTTYNEKVSLANATKTTTHG